MWHNAFAKEDSNDEMSQSLLTSYKFTSPAFTLAKVLITLAIIGVVAALTIPVIVPKCRKMVTVTRLQKMYSSFNQALLLIIRSR